MLINGAGILIDLLKANLIEPFFRLKYELHITDFVVNEVLEDNAAQPDAFVDDGSLIKKTFEISSVPFYKSVP